MLATIGLLQGAMVLNITAIRAPALELCVGLGDAFNKLVPKQSTLVVSDFSQQPPLLPRVTIWQATSAALDCTVLAFVHLPLPGAGLMAPAPKSID